MKFEWIGRCFRIEVEFYTSSTALRFRPNPRREVTDAIKRKAWRQIRAQLKSEARPCFQASKPLNHA